MSVFSKFTAVCLVMISALNAHEHWLFTESPHYSVGDSVVISLRSGHTVGESEFLIDTNLIQNAIIICPDNKQEKLHFMPRGQEHIASFRAMKSGIYTVMVNLRKRNKGPSIYLTKTRFKVGTQLNAFHPQPTQELEIMTADSDTSFSVFERTAPVKVPLTLLTPDKAERSLIMERTGISRFSPNQAGLYVLICHFRRQTASYSLYMGK